ncbi:MAG: lipid II flippase MurJ [Candidatus Zixiibacteriota bacterium]
MPPRTAKAVFSVATVLLISRLLGFVREIVIADVFGTSAQYDLYLVAIMLPALLSAVLSFASVYLLVPYFSRKLENATGREQAADWSALWPAINLTVLVAVGVAALIALFAPLIMKIWGGGYLETEFGDIVFYCRVTSAMVILGTTEACMRAYLNVRRIFTYSAAGYLVYNAFCVAAIVVFHQQFSIGAVAIGLLGGLAVQNIYLLLKVLSFKPFEKLTARVFDVNSKAILATGGVIILVEFINRSYFLIDRYVAQQFGEGIISALNYGQVLIQLPDSIIGLAIGVVVFPIFSDASNKPGSSRFGELYRKAITGVVLLAVPIAAYFMVASSDLVHLLLHRGQFDNNSVELTANILMPYAPSIVALFITSTSIRACYSGGWGKQVLLFAAVIFAIKFAATFILAEIVGYGGISAATSLSHVGFAGLMLMFLSKRLVFGDKPRFLYNIIVMILLGVLMVLIGNAVGNFLSRYFESYGITDVLARLALLALCVVVVYWLGLSLLGLKSLFWSYLKWPAANAEKREDSEPDSAQL